MSFLNTKRCNVPLIHFLFAIARSQVADLSRMSVSEILVIVRSSVFCVRSHASSVFLAQSFLMLVARCGMLSFCLFVQSEIGNRFAFSKPGGPLAWPAGRSTAFFGGVTPPLYRPHTHSLLTLQCAFLFCALRNSVREFSSEILVQGLPGRRSQSHIFAGNPSRSSGRPFPVSGRTLSVSFPEHSAC